MLQLEESHAPPFDGATGDGQEVIDLLDQDREGDDVDVPQALDGIEPLQVADQGVRVVDDRPDMVAGVSDQEPGPRRSGGIQRPPVEAPKALITNDIGTNLA